MMAKVMPVVSPPLLWHNISESLWAGIPLRDYLADLWEKGQEQGRWETMSLIKKVCMIRVDEYQLIGSPALDRIITQLMENSNASRPVAATEDIMEKLPREVLEVGCKSCKGMILPQLLMCVSLI
jgi:hypothetical protein